MRLVAFLNELSHPTDEMSDVDAKRSVEDLIRTLRRIKDIRPALELHSVLPLPSIVIGRGRVLSSLRTDGDSRDLWRFLRGLQNKAFDFIDESIDFSVEYEHEGERCIGLGLAHACESLAVSFVGKKWADSAVELVCYELDDDGDIGESIVRVRHAAEDTDVLELQDWLRALPLTQFEDGEDLWNKRQQSFPSLRFLPRTEQQLLSLRCGSPELQAINLKLWQLERAAQDWSENTPLPSFSSKVTPEHKQRQKLCQFESSSYGVQSFDLHARFTPGAGRIHIWCNSKDRTIEVGHIGDKL